MIAAPAWQNPPTNQLMSLSAEGQRGPRWAVWASIVSLLKLKLPKGTTMTCLDRYSERPQTFFLLLQTVTLALRVWTRLIPAETECQCHRQISGAEERVRSPKPRFSGQAGWQPDATLRHSAHSGGGGLSGAKKHASENTGERERECHIVKTSQTTLAASERDPEAWKHQILMEERSASCEMTDWS